MSQLLPCPICAAPVSAASALCSSCGCRFHKGSVGLEPDGMTCFKCGLQTDGMPRSCPGCGARYYVECPQCGYEYPPNERFCPQCRADRLAEQEHELLPEHEPRKPMRATVATRLTGFVGLLGLAAIVLYGARDHIWIAVIALLVLAVFSIGLVSGAAPRLHRRPKPLVQDDLVEVFNTIEASRADHLAALLESEGIPAFSNHRTLIGLSDDHIAGGCRVLVPTERVAEARELMAAFDFESELDLDSVQAGETFDQATWREPK